MGAEYCCRSASFKKSLLRSSSPTYKKKFFGYAISMKYKGVIFDLDGTLVDTISDIAASMNKALEKHGFPSLETEAYRDKVGWGIRRLAALCILHCSYAEPFDIEMKAAAVAETALSFYSEEPLLHSKPYPGIKELVAELRNRKIKTAVLTNKPHKTAQLVVAGLFPQDFFSFVRGEVFGNPRKPDPASVWELLVDMDLSPADIVFTGDSEVDMETAVSSGCFPLGVSWGYRSREAIIGSGARHIIESPEELLDFF